MRASRTAGALAISLRPILITSTRDAPIGTSRFSKTSFLAVVNDDNKLLLTESVRWRV